MTKLSKEQTKLIAKFAHAIVTRAELDADDHSTMDRYAFMSGLIKANLKRLTDLEGQPEAMKEYMQFQINQLELGL